jgi:outer membrane immunogenic protein
MNRKLLMGAAFYLAGAGLAQADNLPPSYDTDWTGLYATLSAGYSNVSLDSSQLWQTSTIIGPVGSGVDSDKDSSSGAIFGVGAGFNYDWGGFVLGLEGDINYLTNENTLEMKTTVEADYDWFATGRLRGGIDLDGTLLYGTGGVAFLRADIDNGGNTHSETFFGWTAGAGIEKMISESWTLRVEALYADFGSENFSDTFSDEIFTTVTDTDLDAEMFIVRTGLSLRF